MHFFSHSYRGWKFKIKMSAELVSLEASILGLQMAAFALCSHVIFPLCVHAFLGFSVCLNFLFL